ncbi:hypothetical protein [Nocardioides dilutus]
MSRGRRDLGFDLALAALVAFLVLGPVVLRRGFVLRGDMVFVPHQPWKDAWLALDGSAPRFVPGDAVLSLVTMVVPGDLFQKAILLAALVLGGTGAGRLVREHSPVGRVAAIVLMMWNPWVLERLSIGQWGSVVGYAALPYVVLAAVRVRDGTRGGFPTLTLWLAFTALWSPASALAGALTSLCVVAAGRRARRVLVTTGLAVLVNLPWLVPSLLNGDRIVSPDGQFEAFAARAESGAGLLASIASLGGIWKSSVVPGERTVAVVVLLSCLTTVVALVALWRTRRDLDADERATRHGLTGLAVVAVAMTLLPAAPGLTDAFDSGAQQVGALSALRDGHRFLGPAVLVLLPGVALAADALWHAGRRGREALRAVAVLLALLPALCLPSMAWGLGGDLRPVTYPLEWFRVKSVVDQDVSRRGGATIVLPWRGTYRGFDWNDSRAQLDPAPRFFSGEVLIDDRILLGGDADDDVLSNEDPRLAAITDALAEDAPAAALSQQGVARVLVEKGNGVAAGEVPAGEVLHDGPLLTVVAISDPEFTEPAGRSRRAAIIAADVMAGLACLVAVGCIRRRQVYGEPAVDSGRGT